MPSLVPITPRCIWNLTPYGDAADKLRRVHMYDISLKSHGTKEKVVSSYIELWANAASDHFYDLDRNLARPPLCELADLTLKMGHGFTDTVWTVEDMDRVRELWKESCLALDLRLGTIPDWGTC